MYYDNVYSDDNPFTVDNSDNPFAVDNSELSAIDQYVI